MKTSVSEIRLRAAEILAAGEWCRHQMRWRKYNGDPVTAYCLAGACMEAAGYWDAFDRGDQSAGEKARAAWSAVDEVRAHLGIADGVGIGPWNDAACRTKGEVIAALRHGLSIPGEGE